jgi:hypothetical protein
MADFVIWRFLIFTVVFGVLIYLQFYLAHRQWRSLKGEQAGEIDVNYVRTENYLPQSFRMKVTDWLQLPVSEDKEFGPVILKGTERIRSLPTLEMADQADCDDILVVARDFSCGRNCTLRRELLVHGSAHIGSDSRLQSLAADGDLHLGERVTAARWLDSSGELTMSAGCRTGSRVTSLTRIRMGLGVEVPSAFAPEVGTAGWDSNLQGDEPARRELLEIWFQGGLETATRLNFQAARFLQLGADTWLYKGPVQAPIPVRLRTNLVITGDCYFPAGSVLEADLKASGSIFLGPACVIQGSLVADGHIFLANGCRFSKLVHAEKTLLLSRGARGFRPDGMVAAYAGECLNMETDVAVKGKVSSAGRVVVINPAAANAWRVRRGIEDDGSRLGKAHLS